MLIILLPIWLYLKIHLSFANCPSHNVLSAFFLKTLRPCLTQRFCNCCFLCLECSSPIYMCSYLLHLLHLLKIYSQMSSYWSGLLATPFLTATTLSTPCLSLLSYLYPNTYHYLRIYVFYLFCSYLFFPNETQVPCRQVFDIYLIASSVSISWK